MDRHEVSAEMSKLDILRGIVSERLSTAAQEIFAVVERTVNNYEEEASRLRQELERQRRHCHALLQPRVQLDSADPDVLQQLPACKEEVDGGEPHVEEQQQQQGGRAPLSPREDQKHQLPGWKEEVGGGEPHVEEQQQRGRAPWSPREGSKNTEHLFSAVEENDEEGFPEGPVVNPDRHQKGLEDLDYQTPSRLPSARRKPRRSWSGNESSHLILRICVLEDSHTNVLSKIVFKKCPIRKVQCPLGLKEADFLVLLKTTFPQLAGDDRPFDIFTTDRSRRLQPLKLEILTAESICKALGSRGAGNALYIQLKAGEEHLQPLQQINIPSAPSSPWSLLRSETNQAQNEESDSRDLLDKNSTQQQMDSDEDAHIDLGVSDPADSEDNDGVCQRPDDSDEPTDRGDDYWKQNESDEDLRENEHELWSLKTARKRCVKQRGQGAKSRKSVEMSQEESVKQNNPTLACRVCGALHGSVTILIKHAWSHLEAPGHLCGACGEPAESAKALEDHLQSHQKTYNCHICGKSYLSIVPFRSHVAAHEGHKPYKCGVCHKEFSLKSSFKCHERSHVMNKPHKCDVCHKEFVLKREVEAHRRIHTGGKSFCCSLCGKSLSDLRSLSHHMLLHRGERRHCCKVCGKSFTLHGGLKEHEKIHTTREKPYLCHICCKAFPTNGQLKIHMRTHTKERPYRCNECSKDFVNKGSLIIHMRIHTGETPYNCQKCGRSFRSSYHYTRHLRVHAGLKPYICSVCGKGCSLAEHLKVHMRTHTGERPYKCTVCDKAFTQSHCLKTHMKIHQAGESSTSAGSVS